MSLADSTVRIRPRVHWEAHDLGFAMGRRWCLPLMGLWLICCLPVAASLMLGLGADSWIPFVVVWWFKPLYEWPLVYWISQRVFATPLTVRQSLAVLKPGRIGPLLPYLLWRRFSPQRSFTMPVGMLEGLRGEERTQRVNLLAWNQSAASWLIVVCFHFESILLLSVYLCLLFFAGDNLADERFLGTVDLLAISPWVQMLLMVLAYAFMAPFFVAAGFAAYLARRTQLEAWDLELVFRDLAQRLRQERSSSGSGFRTTHQPTESVRPTRNTLMALLSPCAAALLIATLGLGGAQWAQAQEKPEDEIVVSVDGPDTAQELVTEILEHKDFGYEETVTEWRYREAEEEVQEEESEFTFPFVRWFALILEVVLWLSVFAALIWGGMYLANALGWITPSMRQPDDEALAVNPEPQIHHDNALPDDIPAAVAALLKADQRREALALLYRASLLRLAASVTAEIPESATEGECRRWVRHHCVGPQAQFFDGLARAWIQAAYGTRLPARDQVAQWLQRWSQVFEVPA